VKIYRGYLKKIGFTDLKMGHQRQQILKKLEKKFWVEEKLTHQISMEKESEVCSDHNLDLITMMGRSNYEVSKSLLKNGIPDPRKPRVILYWYIDQVNRDGFHKLMIDLNPEERVLTMDFTLPQEILDTPQFHLIKERRSHLPTLFNLIRDLWRQGFSWRKISDQIMSKFGVKMSHVTVGKVINENNLGFVKVNSGLFV
jgi:hypothetical protein